MNPIEVGEFVSYKVIFSLEVMTVLFGMPLCSDSELVPPAKQPAPFPNATVVYDPPGDRSCQFAAVSHQLNLAGIPD